MCGLWTTPVKGTRLLPAQRLMLGAGGVQDDRRFYLIDERDRMVNGKQIGALSAVVAELPTPERLRLTFPGGRVVEDTLSLAEPVAVRFYSRPRRDRLVVGPWAEALSVHVGRPLWLVHADASAGAVDRGTRGGVSLISRGSLAALAAEVEVDTVDVRRFRMTIEIDGVEPNAEDRWVGRELTVGGAVIRVHGHVGRCLVTSRDPESGEIDLPTLDVLAGYRGNVEATEALPLGVYAEVVRPGPVTLGDPVRAPG